MWSVTADDRRREEEREGGWLGRGEGREEGEGRDREREVCVAGGVGKEKWCAFQGKLRERGQKCVMDEYITAGSRRGLLDQAARGSSDAAFL